ncbi:MAG: hypothetical protein LUG99_00530 [Lachnospiraceae bacterium]|nr:hypothetical protein [Lachnospiraceae bacterium]
MAYNEEHVTKLGHLKDLAERINAKNEALQTQVDSISSKVDSLVNTGGEPNTIESISVNGSAQEIDENKNVNIVVPTKTSDLTNDSGFQSETEVGEAIQAAIAGTGHASFQTAESVPTADDAEENVLYLVMNSETGYYDIYALVSGSVVLIDDTSIDLTNYVEKETGKGLSTNDYTDEEKEKLAGLSNYTHPSYTAQASGLYMITVDSTGHVSAVTEVTADDIANLGVKITDTTYSEATTTEAGLMSASDKTKLDGIEIATDDEVTEALDEVFGTSSEDE